MKEEFYFSPIGPFGSDDGSDTFAGFVEWRKINKTEDPHLFLMEQIAYWGYPQYDKKKQNFKN